MKALRVALIGALIAIGCSGTALAMSVDDALGRLKAYKFGQDDEVINTIRDAAVGSFGDAATRQKLAAGLAAVLEADATNDAKHFACRQLALIATDEQVPALAKLLTDPQMSQMARYALARIPGEGVDRALIDALGRTEGANKLGIINTLGNRRTVAAVGPLAALLRAEQKEIVGEAAAALGRIGTPEAARALDEAMAKAPEASGPVLADAYLMCADRLRAEGQLSAAASMYDKVLKSSQPSYVQAAALRGMASAVPPAEAATLIIKGLSSPDPDLRSVAARSAQEIAGAEVTRALAEQLPKLSPAAQILLLQALGVRGDRAAIAAVTSGYNSPETSVRVAAIEAMGAVGDASSVRLLAEWAARGNERERAAGAASLMALRGTGIDAELLRQLREVLPNVKAEIIKALAARNATTAVLEVLNEAASGDAAVRTAAIRALRDLAQAEHVAALVDLLTAMDTPHREEVRKTLVAVTRRCSSEEQAAQCLVAKCQGLQDVERKSVLLAALGDLGHGAGLPVLRSALKDDNAQIRRAALVALSNWPNVDPMPDLLEVARQRENRTHQVLALRGYVDLVGRSTSMEASGKLRCYETALGLAPDAAEKRRVLAALPTVKTVGALQLAAAHVQDKEVGGEAALAAVTIANDIYGANAGPVKEALTRVAAADVRPDIKDKANQILGDIETAQSYLTDWEVAGPYMEKDKNYAQLFDIAFGPEVANAQVQWRKMPVSTSGEQAGYLDLLKELNGGEQRVAYLRTQIESAQLKPVTLEVFSDDGVKVWLNGKVVHAHNVARPISPAPDRVTATLQQGVNKLMLKVTQNNLPWGAIVRVRDAKPVEPKVGEGFKLHIINADSRFEAAGVLDVNRDGKLDILCGGFWYEAPNWEKHLVREIKEEGNYFYDFANLPMDVDGDGWTDTVGAAWHNKMVYWVRNPGKAGGAWPVFEIDTPGNMETALAFDINGDGQMDILPNIMTEAAWYEFHRHAAAPGGARWQKHQLPKEAAGHGLGAGDINKDGRCDIVAPKGWLEQTATGWQWRPEFDLGSTSIPILVHDVDGDGQPDIVWGLGHDYGIYWLEQKNANGQRTWEKHLIDKSWSQPHFMLMADLDNDGKAELVTGKRYYAHNGNDPGENDPECVYYYKFDAATKDWTRHTIHEGGRVGFGINTAVVDIDGDGDLDVVAPGKSGLYLLENVRKSK